MSSAEVNDSGVITAKIDQEKVLAMPQPRPKSIYLKKVD